MCESQLIPVPYGHRVSVRMRREGDNIFVEVHAPSYVHKQWDMPHCYTDEFTVDEILNDYDFHRVLKSRFGTI